LQLQEQLSDQEYKERADDIRLKAQEFKMAKEAERSKIDQAQNEQEAREREKVDLEIEKNK